MSETTARFNEEKSAAAAPQPPPPYPNYQPPYATYGANPNYPMAQPVLIYPQGMPMDPSIQRIHEYFPWSIINFCFGGVILGVIAVILSLQTRSRKRMGNAESARKWSIATLLFNIFATLVGVGIIIFIIVWFAVAAKNINNNAVSYYG